MATKFNTPTGASASLFQDASALLALETAGWDIDHISNTKNVEEFGVLHRCQNRNFATAPPLNLHASLTGNSKNTPVQDTGSNAPMGRQQVDLTPPVTEVLSVSPTPKAIVPLDVTKLQTLKRIRSDRPRLVFAVDTEFYYPHGSRSREREILTWQVSFEDPEDNTVHSLVFFSCKGKRLGLGRMVSYCLTRFSLVSKMRGLGVTKCDDNGYRFEHTREWAVPLYDTQGALWDGYRICGENPDWGTFKTFEEAHTACKDPDFSEAYELVKSLRKHPSRVKLNRNAYDLPNGKNKDRKGRGLAGYVNNFHSFHQGKLAIPVTILCHTGKADLSAFTTADCEKDVMRNVSEVQGGLVTMQGFTMNPPLCNGSWWRFLPLSMDVRDTMCFAAAGHKSLDELGEAVGFEKLELKEGYSKDKMHLYLDQEPVAFMEYASRDAEVTLRYAGTLFGFNKSMPVTSSSAAVKSIVETIKNDWGLSGNADFDREWRGLHKVDIGQSVNPATGTLQKQYRENDPLNVEAALIQMFARNSYKGGANGCSSVGWIEGLTHDLDLCSAYPTAMSCVFDVDWTADKLIVREWIREDALLQDFRTPFDPIWAYVDEFEFPPEVPFPCIAVNIGGCIVFPRTLGKRDGVYLTGVEIYTALKLGARVHIQHGYQAKYRLDKKGNPTRSLFLGVRDFVEDRSSIKKAMKDGQAGLVVYEQLEKTMVNSSYGKTAQNVVEKHTWNAKTQEMESLGMSRITSPTHSSMTTAIVRCLLMAAMNELHMLGHVSHSFTTDGFVTTADADIVNTLNLCGMAPYLRQVRTALTGRDTVWEAKHHQDCFYNVTTRGNMSPDVNGVCAHNSYVSPYLSKSIEDRLYCLDVWLSRDGKVDCTVGVWAKFKDMADSVLRDDFYVEDRLRKLSMDFDMKRKPIKDSLTTKNPAINGSTYEVGNVLTTPYETPEEYELYKSRAKTSDCLRTETEWRSFFVRVESATIGVQRHVADFEWSQIFTCVMGHRLGVWNIPKLNDDSLTVEEKCEWIEGFNKSPKRFKPSHWKNARRQERQTQMLNRADVLDLLEEMGATLK